MNESYLDPEVTISSRPLNSLIDNKVIGSQSDNIDNQEVIGIIYEANQSSESVNENDNSAIEIHN